MAKNNYWVSPRDDGKWEAQRQGSQKAAGVFERQGEAEELARQILQNSGGGELITQNRQGQIRSKDTISAPDPFPPRDTEH